MVTIIDKETALVLIDLQKGIVQQKTATPISDILEKAAKLVEAFRKANLPVVVVNVHPSGAWMKTRKETAPRLGGGPLPSEFFEIVPEIKTESGDIFITKHTWNAFYETPLDEELKKKNITGIVLAGVATSMGVEGTARAASERGYNITFARDAMTDIFADAHEKSLQYIFPRMGEIGDTDEIIAKMIE